MKKTSLFLFFLWVTPPRSLVPSSPSPLPTCAPGSGKWGRVQGQIWSLRRRHHVCTWETEGPVTLEGHSQSCDPGGGKHSKCRSLPRHVSPAHGHVHNPPSMSGLSHPNRVGWGWGQGGPWRGPAKHQEMGSEQWQPRLCPTTMSSNHMVQNIHWGRRSLGVILPDFHPSSIFPRGGRIFVLI